MNNENQVHLNLSLLPEEFHKFHKNPETYFLSLLPQSTSLPRQAIKSALRQIGLEYNNDDNGVFYHNVTHGFDVAITMEKMIRQSALADKFHLTQETLVLFLIAAYAHDVGHEGLSNEYYIDKNHPLALTYLYNSPLEHMHASKLMKILKDNNLQIDLPLRKKMIHLILATDSNSHGIKMEKLKNVLVETVKQNQMLIFGSLIHAADIGNPTKDFQLFERWSDKIQMQFNRQVHFA